MSKFSKFTPSTKHHQEALLPPIPEIPPLDANSLPRLDRALPSIGRGVLDSLVNQDRIAEHLKYLEEAQRQLLDAHRAAISRYESCRGHVLRQRKALLATAHTVKSATEGASILVVTDADIKRVKLIDVPPQPVVQSAASYEAKFKRLWKGFNLNLGKAIGMSKSPAEFAFRAMMLAGVAAYSTANAQKAIREMAVADTTAKTYKREVATDREILHIARSELVTISATIHDLDNDMRKCVVEISAEVWQRYREQKLPAEEREIAERLLRHAAFANAYISMSD